MKVGFIGLGKLGMPIAVMMAAKGHQVLGYDVNPNIRSVIKTYPHMEDGYGGNTFQQLLDKSTLKLSSFDEVLSQDMIFVAVQTPHDPMFEGITRLPADRKNFDYSHLDSTLDAIELSVKDKKIVCVISTVLPGTLHASDYKNIRLVYNPYFIAMGTTIQDFLHPEFILVGSDDVEALSTVTAFYKTITSEAVFATTVANAELIKVAYNTVIGTKIVIANTLMEICDRMGGMDVDVVTSALQMATQRIVSPRYMTAGMGDSGHCHPRDNIALSWLVSTLDMDYDLFGGIMAIRETQAEYLCIEMMKYDLPKAILGYTYKKNINLTGGSSALLCKSILEEYGQIVKIFDPMLDTTPVSEFVAEPQVVLIGMNHKSFVDVKFANGSVIIDPFRYIPLSDDYTVIHIGKR